MNNKYFVKLLYQAGLGIVTKQRLEVLSFLANADQPKSAKEIAKILSKKGVDQATVYRILARFKEGCIINQIDFQEDQSYFELKDRGDHHHIICQECKKVEDFKGCNYDNLVNSISKNKTGFAKITGHSFELFGICKSCLK